MNIEIIISILTLLGVGSVLGTLIKSKSDKNRDEESRISVILENRYRSTLVFMRIFLQPESIDHFDIKINPSKKLKTNIELEI
ncbi:MAG TPA: hypothetical protein ENH23_04070 [candidate division Zixibacteria bacterium]|nr:hypothetical protein [candidate division Zixibacteria bacterium]